MCRVGFNKHTSISVWLCTSPDIPGTWFKVRSWPQKEFGDFQSSLKKNSISWRGNKELKRTVSEPVDVTYGPKAHRSSGICLGGVSCSGSPPTAAPTDGYKRHCRHSNDM